MTLKLAGISFAAAAIVGFWFALCRINGSSLGKRLVAVYLSIIRGVPIVVQILIIYSMFPSIFQSLLDAVGSSYKIWEVNPIVYAYIVFILNTTAGLTEVFRYAILTVDRGQLEAAEAAGLTVPMAYFRIIIPQRACIGPAQSLHDSHQSRKIYVSGISDDRKGRYRGSKSGGGIRL